MFVNRFCFEAVSARTKAALLPAILLLLAQSSAFAQVQYAITDLGTLGGGESFATGINNSGQVVGYDQTGGVYHGFLYSGGTMQGIGDFPGGTGSIANGINDSGQIVGQANIANSWFAFVCSGGSMQNLGTLGGAYSSASGINNAGQVVGTADTPSHGSHGFISSGSTMNDLGAWPLFPTSINASEQVVGYAPSWHGGSGWRAFSYSRGTLADLGNLGGVQSLAYGVNSVGQVVGESDIASGSSHAFLFGGGTMTDLGTLGDANGYSRAYGINSTAQVVGSATDANWNTHAFLYSDGTMADLNNLIAPSPGWTLGQAKAINDKGQIVGSGTNPAGQTRAFLLSPLSTIATGAPPNTPGNTLKPVNPTTTPPSGNLKRWDGTSWQSVTSWNDPNIHTDQPTVVLAHGWGGAIDGSTNSPTLISKVAAALFQQDSSANILGWDWSSEAALPAPGGMLGYAQDIAVEGLRGAARCADAGALQGKILSGELQNLHISNDKLQLIGHSNGAAVVGVAASVLAQDGQPVERLTSLDAPNVTLGGITANAVKYLNPKTASQVEVYYSDNFSAGGFGTQLNDPMATNVFNGQIYPGSQVIPPTIPLPPNANLDHLRILDPWYSTDKSGTSPQTQGLFVAGINWSILSSQAGNLKSGDYSELGQDTGVFSAACPLPLPPLTNPLFWLTKRSVDGFEDGTSWNGQHAEIVMRDPGNAAAKIMSGSDGYLWKDVSVPSDAMYLTFDLKIETPDVGDFLTVSLGNELLFYKALNAADNDFWTVDPIFIGDFAGQTEMLLFTLNHVGDGTPSILLDNITFSAVPEPSTLILLGVAAVALLGYQWRWRKRTA